MALRRIASAFITLIFAANGLATTSVTGSVIHFQEHAPSIMLSGKLANKAEQKSAFKIAGVIANIYVEEGDRINAGQLLASLDKAEITAQVEQAKSVYTNAQSNLKRVKALYADNIVSQEQYNKLQTELQVAKSNLQIAQFNLKHADIHALNEGRILHRFVEKNEMVSPSQPILTISNEYKGWVLRAGISDKEFVQVSHDNKVDIVFDAYPGHVFQGEVSELAAAADGVTGLFEIEVQLQATTKRLFSGLIAQGKVYTEQTQSVALIPIESIISANGKVADVFVINKQLIAERRRVTIAFIEDDKVAITHGLTEGEMVVRSGSTFIRDGNEITLAKQY
ncbi:efflux RND transporter periplasmic adaptor subunit [Alteromonadaceae bacterium BrNp21-10]|nr:efflux RND transporter periplasmic adaptor subunit [Alteromonadaceae bacterium BrNp21-10]